MKLPQPLRRAGWYTRRLALMSPAEVLWRGSQVAGEWVSGHTPESRGSARLLPGTGWTDLAANFRQAASRPLLLDRARARAIAQRHPHQVAELVEAAERVRAGHVTYFGYPEVLLRHPVDWNFDALSGFRWPAARSSRIDHRVAPADPKWIWELNRLQHLPWLAEAWLFTGDDGFAETALGHLDTWLDQNPPGRGIAWRGAFEAGVRAISVAVALQGLRDYDGLGDERLERATRMLAASAEVCWRHRSRFSSANNHLVGELAGLATVAMMLPELADAARWERSALQALEVEASRQILPDGSGAEQAVGYQLFTAELLLVVAVLLRSRGSAVPAGILGALDRSADHLAAVVGRGDPDPRYGDEDEGFALRLGPEARRTVREHLGLVAALTHNSGARAAGRASLSAGWVEEVVGPTELPPSPDAEDAVSRSLFAPDGGLVVLRAGRRRVTMDVGPLGYLSIAAHGHADALAVTLSIDEHEVVGDPGAASYYGHPRWREVHRGTRVHATVTVDGENQSVARGPFMWSDHAQVRVNAVDLERGVVDAEHDGYHRLPNPVKHRRWLSAAPQEGAPVVVVDEVSGSGEHESRVSWPLHPDLELGAAPAGQVLLRDDVPVASIALVASSDLVVDRVRSNEDDDLGWWSDRLEARRPSWLLGGVVRGPLPVVTATIIWPSDASDAAIMDPSVSVVDDLVEVSWRRDEVRHAVVVDRSRAGALEVRTTVAADVDSGGAS